MEDLKRSLRKAMRLKLQELSAAERGHSSELLCNFLLTSLSNYSFVGVFAPLASEPDLNNFFNKATAQLCFPSFEDNRMLYRKSAVSDLKETEEFGVKLNCPSRSCEEVIPDVVLVPGLAFCARDGARLGRGKGFYDRFLKGFEGKKVGVCFSFQLIDSVPTEEHDELLDLIITEEKIYQNREVNHG